MGRSSIFPALIGSVIAISTATAATAERSSFVVAQVTENGLGGPGFGGDTGMGGDAGQSPPPGGYGPSAASGFAPPTFLAPPPCPLVIEVGPGLRHPAKTRIVYGRPVCS